jgi:gliding motility-associated protein GldM
MYRGYENKFSVSVPGVSDDRVRVTVNGAKATLKGKEWIIVPGDGAKTVTINVQAELDGKMQSMGAREYRVKQLPPPTAFFSAKEKEYPTGYIAASVLSNPAGTIVASYGPDGLLDIPFTVTSFRAIINGQTTPATGNKFTKQQLDQIAKLKKNNMVILQDIRAEGPGKQELRLSPLVLTVN